MKRFTLLFLSFLPPLAGAITLGPGPSVGTDKKGVTWFQEFQDWSKNDVRALDANDDEYRFNNGGDSARDVIAFYSHDDGTNVFFRLDFFELGYGQESGEVDVYVAIDCGPGGTNWLPDFTETRWSENWDVCAVAYNSSAGQVYDAGFGGHPSEFVGSYWRSDLDGVEFGVKRQFLLARGWDGASPLKFAAFTCRDGTGPGGAGEIYGSDIADHFGTLTRSHPIGVPADTGYLDGFILSTASSGRAKYAVIAHANQAVAPISGTQGHIFRDYDANLKPGFVRLLDSAEMFGAPINLHISGTLLMSFLWAAQDPSEGGLQGYPNRDGPTFVNRVRDFVTTGPGSLIGGVLAEHIMPYFEGEVNQKSIQQNSELLLSLFGLTESDMGVMHVPERVIRSHTDNPHVAAAGPLDGKTFEDIAASDFKATYLDEVTHLHWWFYPNEGTNWNNGCPCDDWAGFGGCDEAAYHHKVHKINGVYCFMINDREDQEKFGPDDGGMQNDTRYWLLQKARSPDYAQITVVFDDWEAFAGNSFASSTPNNNADQFHTTLRWAANHPWIEIVNLRDVLDWALVDPNWIVDHGTNNFDKTGQTYEYLKRSSEQDYDHWYYGSDKEESFFDRIPAVHSGWSPAGMKKYGDLNTTNTLLRDAWDTVQQIASTNLKKLAEWSYSAMIYETAWHDEDANPDQYKSRNYQVSFDRNDACALSYADTTYDIISGWAVGMHGHARDLGVLKAASDWAQDV